MPRWGMVIDLQRCVGCYACTVACKIENATPPGIWYAPVYEKEVGDFPNVRRVFVPTLCNHCEDAPCVSACPSGALTQRDDGIVTIDQGRCIGSRACMAACPYGALHFYEGDGAAFETELTPLEALFQAKWQPGTVQKCTFCAHRIDQGIYEPACVQSCPAECRIFGDLSDPESAVSRLIAQHNAAPIRPEAGTGASVYYIR